MLRRSFLIGFSAAILLSIGCTYCGPRPFAHHRPLLPRRAIAPAPSGVVDPVGAPVSYGGPIGYSGAVGGFPADSGCASCAENVARGPVVGATLTGAHPTYPHGGQPLVTPQPVFPGSEPLGPPTIVPPGGKPKVELIPNPMPKDKPGN